MRRYDEPTETIQVAAHEQFAISLAANPTTGYGWQASVDRDYVELHSQEFEPGAQAPGAAGRELFQFRARQAGKTAIDFEYRRPWGGPARETRRCPVLIVE
jgi:inhibitor of cysteine peptidase